MNTEKTGERKLGKMIEWGKSYMDGSMCNISEFADPEDGECPSVHDFFLKYNYGAAEYEFSDCAEWLFSEIGAAYEALDGEKELSDDDRDRINNVSIHAPT